jgi:hypothetical protein
MNDQPPSAASAVSIRATVILVAGAQTVFWLYTWYYILGHANPKGDGMELMATMPMTMIFLVLVAPALVLGLAGRALRTALVLLLIALVLNFFIWSEVVKELASHGR